MDSCKSYLLSPTEEALTIEIPEFDSEHLALIERYIKISESLQEIEQLFQLFYFNVYSFSSNCKLCPDDKVLMSRDMREADLITVNGYFINIISAGRVFVDRLELFLKEDLEIDRKEEFRHFYLSKVYDEKFAYRFFYGLRNICQHGHLVVSHNPFNNSFCFDLDQILKNEHISPSARYEDEWSRIVNDINEKFHSEPYLCFTHNVDEYVNELFSTYCHFLEFVFENVESICNRIDEIIKENPQYISGEPFEGWVVYKCDNGNAQMFNPKEKLLEWFSNIKREANIRLEKYDAMFHS